MTPMAVTPFSLRVLLLLLAHGVTGSLLSYSSPQIADLNILLPPRMANPVHYRLLGTGGCFSWTWDHHDILHVEPEYNDTRRCSTSARLVSIAPYSGRKETAVYAADINTGAVIRCEVFIDNISRIQIFHHSVKLDLDGLATLQIRAFDSEDNVFSSLVGLRFVWKLMPKSVDFDPLIHHLVHVPLKETPLTDCGGFCGDLDTQIRVEDSGMGSDLYVIKGVKIGHEIVSAQLFEPQYENVTDKIILTVAEAMSLLPTSPVFVIVGSLIHYKLRVVHQNHHQVVDLPSPVHRWLASNSTVAQVDSAMGSARVLNLGITNVIVEDTRVTGHFQISTMHVVIPYKLCLYIMPSTDVISNLEPTKCSPSAPCFVVIGREYAIIMKAFTQEPNENEIFITESNKLTLGSDSLELWDISFAVPNDMAAGYGWRHYRIFKPLATGQGFLFGSLSYNKDNPGTLEVLKVEQRVIVCDEVKIILENKISNSKDIKLPWAPGIHQGIELKASGGCGMSSRDYTWSSADPAFVSVSSLGYVHANYPGHSTIRVTSVFDPLNFDEIVVEVSTPASMALIQKFPVEALVGTDLFAGVLLKTSDGSYFDRCNAFNSIVKWRVVSEREVFSIINRTGEELIANLLLHGPSEEISGSPCSWRYLYASNQGHAVLHASFSSIKQSSDLLLDGEVALQMSAQIAAYSPLAAFQVGDGDQYGGYHRELPKEESARKNFGLDTLHELYLAPGSAMDVFISGGPDRWSHNVEYIDTVVINREGDFTPKALVSKKIITDDGTFYSMLCRNVGNFVLVFSRGNLAGDDHPFPAISNVEVTLVCTVPFSIALIANEKSNTFDVISSSLQADRSLGKIRISPVVLASGHTIRLAAIGIHVSGRPFSNSSSLSLRWELSGCDGLAKWADVDGLENVGMNWERFLSLENSSGLCTVRATVIGFPEKIFSNIEDAHLLPEISEDYLTDAVYLQLVSMLRIVPESVLLYFNTDAKVNLSIVGGTCFTDAVSNNTQVAEIIQPSKNAHCSWLMLAARGLGTAVVTVYDIGLSPPVRTSASVTVADVDWIKIMGDDEISLMEGTRSSLEILAGTSDGSIFDSSMFLYMDIYAHVEDSVIDVEHEDGSPAASNKKLQGSKFFIKAQTLGLTSLSVSIRRKSGHEICSQILRVEVYAQMRMHPESIFLAPGASYVFSVEGGPSLGSGFDYKSMDDEVVAIDGVSGKLTAIATGNTTVRASIYKSGGSLICEAFAKVEVGIPLEMNLNMQSEYLCVGCKMPVFPAFLKGDLFSFYEVCKGYTWSVDEEKVVHLGFLQHSRIDSHLKNKSSYSLDNKDYGFINFLHGRSEGIARISVSFSCHFSNSAGSKAALFNVSRSLRVMPELPLALGLPITWVLPPFYSTSDLLPGSSESHKQSDRNRKKTSIAYSLLSSSGKDGLAHQDAITISGTKIKTRGSNVLSCIQAKDQSGRLEVAACVRVAEVAQVRATAGSSSYSSHVAYLSSDDRLGIFIGYCDYLGYPFHEAHGVTALDVQNNRPDVVSIHGNISHDSDLVYFQAKSRGAALVKISFKHDPFKAAYILVLVGPHLHPANPLLYVGSVSSFGLTEANGLDDVAAGHWLSSNESVLSIEGHSGKARALAEGVTQVIYEAPSLKLQTTATVKKMDLITVNPPAEIILTNVPSPVKAHKFSVQLRDDPDMLGQELPFDCGVEPPFIGYVTPWKDDTSGSLYCVFFPYSPSSLVDSLSKIKDSSSSANGMSFVSVSASLKRAPHLSGSSGKVLFFGGFSLSQDKLNFSPGFNRSLVTISGNTDVEISWDATRRLSVRTVKKEHFGAAGRAEYEVQVLERGRFSDVIVIKLPATGQTAHINVSYDDERERAAPRERNSLLLWAAILVSLALLTLTIVAFLRFLERPEGIRSTPPPPPPSVPADVSSLSTPGGVSSSPRTPQPFVEYVRRTIDETPYYKREGRRRFDPQRTY